MLALLEPPGRSLDGTFLISGHYAAILEKKCSAYTWAAPLLQLREIEEKALAASSRATAPGLSSARIGSATARAAA